MNAIPFPLPDASIVARREVIIAALSKLVAPDCLITSEDERRAFDTDALTAYRRLPLAGSVIACSNCLGWPWSVIWVGRAGAEAGSAGHHRQSSRQRDRCRGAPGAARHRCGASAPHAAG